jgi:hypothetical protein
VLKALAKGENALAGVPGVTPGAIKNLGSVRVSHISR